ncbi:CinA family protein [Salinigranum salinum]|uniref:CinA family protein n=1 Tax=Salinigranum salinum TaxID=1364937 RepID=UPI001260DD3A|nr:CinA family protein [Salinigranum salinum]
MTDTPVEARVGDALRARGQTVAVAESLTGGLVGSRLTDVPRSSDYFDRAVVTYSNDAKLEELAVSRESLDAHGAVSAPVAREMAGGVRDTAGTTWGVSTTGIAGPTGGTAQKPVGLVFVGVAYAAPWGSDDSFTRAERYVLDGGRDAVKEESATRALSDLLAAVEAVADASSE